MKKLIVVSMGKNTGDAIARQIRRLINEHIIVEVVLISEVAKANIECNLVLFSSEFTAKLALKHLDELHAIWPGAHLVVCLLIFGESAWTKSGTQ